MQDAGVAWALGKPEMVWVFFRREGNDLPLI